MRFRQCDIPGHFKILLYKQQFFTNDWQMNRFTVAEKNIYYFLQPFINPLKAARLWAAFFIGSTPVGRSPLVGEPP